MSLAAGGPAWGDEHRRGRVPSRVFPSPLTRKALCGQNRWQGQSPPSVGTAGAPSSGPRPRRSARCAPPATLHALPTGRRRGRARGTGTAAPRPTPAAQASRLPESPRCANGRDNCRQPCAQSRGRRGGAGAPGGDAQGAHSGRCPASRGSPPTPGVSPLPNQLAVVWQGVSPGPPPPGGLKGEEEAQPVTSVRVGVPGNIPSPHPPQPPAWGPRFSPSRLLAGRAPPDSVTVHSGEQTAASGPGSSPHVYLLLRHRRVL